MERGPGLEPGTTIREGQALPVELTPLMYYSFRAIAAFAHITACSKLVRAKDRSRESGQSIKIIMAISFA